MRVRIYKLSRAYTVGDIVNKVWKVRGTCTLGKAVRWASTKSKEGRMLHIVITLESKDLGRSNGKRRAKILDKGGA